MNRCYTQLLCWDPGDLNRTEESNTDHFYCWITKGPQQSSPIPHRRAAACIPAFPHSFISPFLALGPVKTGSPKQAQWPRSRASPHSDITVWPPWWLFPHHFVPYTFQLSYCSFTVQSHLFSPFRPLNTLPLIFLSCYHHSLETSRDHHTREGKTLFLSTAYTSFFSIWLLKFRWVKTYNHVWTIYYIYHRNILALSRLWRQSCGSGMIRTTKACCFCNSLIAEDTSSEKNAVHWRCGYTVIYLLFFYLRFACLVFFYPVQFYGRKYTIGLNLRLSYK